MSDRACFVLRPAPSAAHRPARWRTARARRWKAPQRVGAVYIGVGSKQSVRLACLGICVHVVERAVLIPWDEVGNDSRERRSVIDIPGRHHRLELQPVELDL
ncbi:hypothetical protein EXIGLDRAFT_728508 [Exidia glandulosa HHB12029]|uniref:Uncharacterized protein n=1 Tax=Exidia glandulosa HHB12029 TaxID=1314781 RepID=A0A165CWE6_EXIGL|nr:hypothetical protein EXIGLDRAFT_728508 [Exidia glandulosa HHB12029]